MKRIEFNDNWSFGRLGDAVMEKVTLPHDAMLGEKRSADNPSGAAGAYFAGGKYLYRKSFFVPQEWQGGSTCLQFCGVYRNVQVAVNGKKAAEHKYGYTPFFVDIAKYLEFGTDNQIEVMADNSEMPNSRWYSGSGIYRNVFLWIGQEIHIEPEGVQVSTKSYSPAVIGIDTVCKNPADKVLRITYHIFDREKLVAKAEGSHAEISIPEAKLWSAETPYQYICRVSVYAGGKLADTQDFSFGIRKIEYSSDGLFINGINTLLRGGCVHHDNGILGARSYKESEWRKVAILKKWGFNAIRSSHNPANPLLLDACDKLGMYVIDEAWDMWYKAKNPYDYGRDFEENYYADLQAIVQRDYNHPSVIMYSIGNEVTEPGEKKGVALTGELTELLHGLDKTRPVTCGVNLTLIMMSVAGIDGTANPDKRKSISSTEFNETVAVSGDRMNLVAAKPEVGKLTAPCLEKLDIAGYNYATSRYEKEGEVYPGRIIVGTETMPGDIAKNWKMVKEKPYLIGDFMWTAIDYLGEAGIGSWVYGDCSPNLAKDYPWLLSEAGAVDILGNGTAEAGLARAVFGVAKSPYIGVCPVNHSGEFPAKAPWRKTNAVPSWSWKGCEGKEAQVEVYAEEGEIELLLNGKSLGRKMTENCKAEFTAIYEPGKLEAVLFIDGVEKSRESMLSATGELGIRISSEQEEIHVGDIVYFPIDICGENGVVEACADDLLAVKVSGGTLLAFGSALPAAEESYLSGRFMSYRGKSIAVVKAEAKEIQITVSGQQYQMVTKSFSCI